MRVLLAGSIIAALVLAQSASSTYKPRTVTSFTIAGCQCLPAQPTTEILGWRGTQPGTLMTVYRDNQIIYQAANPQAPPYNVYLTGQPTGTHSYQICTGIQGPHNTFLAEACSQQLSQTIS